MLVGKFRQTEKAMGYKYDFRPGCSAWNLEQPEEEIFIAGYVKCRNSCLLTTNQQRRLEYYFFERGKGLSCKDLNEVNAILKRLGLEQVVFRETDPGDYALSRDELMKSQRRSQILEEFTDASPEVLAERLAQAGVIANGVRMAPKSKKQANFRRIAERRTERLLDDFRKLENLSSPNYEYTKAEAEKFLNTIHERFEETRRVLLRRSRSEIA